MKRLPALHDLVRRHLDRATARQATYYDKGRREVKFEVGELVMRKNYVLFSAVQNFAAKLAPRFVGPCRIIHAYSPLVNEVNDKVSRKQVKIHVSDLKRYIPPRNHVTPPSTDPLVSDTASTSVVDPPSAEIRQNKCEDVLERKSPTPPPKGSSPRTSTWTHSA